MDTLRLFWIWWRDHLLELVPGHAERRLSRASDGLILGDAIGALDGLGPEASIAVSERRNGVEQPRTRIPLDPSATEQIRTNAQRNRLRIVLRLPETQLLERDVTLPIAAERELGRVLFHEMDRFTPFAANEVLWSYEPLLRDRAQGRITARLSLVPRTAAAPLIEALGRAGLPVSCLEMTAADGDRRRIPLDPSERGRNSSGRLTRLSLIAIAVLLVAAIVSPFVVQSIGFDTVAARIATYQPVVAQVRQLRGTAAAGATGNEVIAEQRRVAGDALEAIALLTEALPDNTYLTGLTFDAGKLTMDGQSKSAASLIAPLTANPRLQDASFTAPVVRNTLGLDSFSLKLRVTR